MDDFAVLYEDCAHVGLPDPRRVDELELWEAAAILGRNRPESETDEDGHVAPTRRGRPETGLERARRLERERPEWMDEPLTPGEQAILVAGANDGR